MDRQDLLFLVRYHVRANERILDATGELSEEGFRRPTTLDYETAYETLLHVAIVDWSWRELCIGNDDDDSYPEDWPPGVSKASVRSGRMNTSVCCPTSGRSTVAVAVAVAPSRSHGREKMGSYPHHAVS